MINTCYENVTVVTGKIHRNDASVAWRSPEKSVFAYFYELRTGPSPVGLTINQIREISCFRLSFVLSNNTQNCNASGLPLSTSSVRPMGRSLIIFRMDTRSKSNACKRCTGL